MKLLVSVALLFSLGVSGSSISHPKSDPDGIEGRWTGSISVEGQTIPFEVTFVNVEDTLRGTIDVQGVRGIMLQQISYAEPNIHFELPAGPGVAVFEGSLQADKSISGGFTQSGVAGTFTMSFAGTVSVAPPDRTVEARHEAILGRWSGAIDAAGQTLPFSATFRVEGSALTGTIEIQGTSLTMDSVTHEGAAVHIAFLAGPGNRIVLEGTLQDDGSIAGSYQQSGVTGTFQLQREAAP
ncbi:MAG: hypothetical protein R3178_03440 [Rhodothermales bacterium]|nr:hypothetical protein [Rhodothermales bacterium]